MSFNSAEMRAESTSGANWNYRTTDSIATVISANYFLPFTRQLTVGNFIQVTKLTNLNLSTEAYSDSTLLRVLTVSSSSVTTFPAVSSTGLYSVVDFGADKTGVSDSATAFAAAIAAGPAYAPPGTYKILSTIGIGANQSLQGAGPTTVLNCTIGGGLSMVQIGIGGGLGGVGVSVRCGLSDLRLRGTAGLAIDVDNAQEFWVERILIGGVGDTTTVLTYGLRARFAFEGRISDISTAVAAISTDHFLFGEAVNGLQANNLYTGNGATSATNVAVHLNSKDRSGTQAQAGNTFNSLVLQGTGKGLYAESTDGCSVNGLYLEQVVQPIVLGSISDSHTATSVIVNSPYFGPITSAHAGFTSRGAVIDFDFAVGCALNGPNMTAIANIYDIAPVTFTGGAVITPAQAFARLRRDGTISSVQVLFGGSYGAPPPTPVIAAIAGETLVANMSGGSVDTISVSAAGTANSALLGDLYPIGVTYQFAIGCSINNPTFYGGVALGGTGYATPFYPLVVRKNSTYGYASMNLENDISIRQGDVAYASMRKTPASGEHFIFENTSTGVLVKTLHSMPVYTP